MGTWEEDQAAIFGGATQEEINAHMRAPGGIWDPANPINQRNPAAPNPAAPNPANPQPNRPRRQTTPFAGDTMGFDPLAGAHAYHLAQGGMLQSMANDAMSAINQENQSRVAQEREMRRMQHEKDLEAMRLNSVLARLQQQQAPSSPYATGFRQDPGTHEWMRT